MAAATATAAAGASWAMEEIYHTLLRCTATSGNVSEQVRLAEANKAISLARQYGRNIVQQLHGAKDSTKQQQSRAATAAKSGSAASVESTAPTSQKPVAGRRESRGRGNKTGTSQPISSSKKSFTALRETKLKPAADFAEMHAEAYAPTLPQGGVCSVLTFSLYIRMLIHILGDAHQPLHNSEVFSKVFRDGDRGGNKVFVTLPQSRRSSATFEDPHEGSNSATVGYTHSLHGEWDSLFGEYETYFYKVDPKTLRNNAQKLVHLYPMDDAAVNTFDNFPQIVQESFDIVRKFVYSEFDWATFTYKSLPYKPTTSYIEKAKQIGESRIAAAGARLALILESLAPSLPQVFVASSSPVTSAWPSPVKFPSQPAWPSPSATSPTQRRSSIKEISYPGSPSATSPTQGRSSTKEISYPGSPSATSPTQVRSSTKEISFPGSPSATSPTQGRSSTKEISYPGSPSAASPPQRQSSTSESSRGRSSTRDSSRRRSSTRDSSRRRSSTRDSSSSSRGDESPTGRDNSGQKNSESSHSSEQDQIQQSGEVESHFTSGSASFVLQRAHAAEPAFVKEGEGKERDNHSPFANAIGTAMEYPSLAAAGIVMLVLVLVLVAVQVCLYKKMQLYKHALHALLSRDSGAITHAALYSAAAETKGTPDAVAMLLAEHGKREQKQSMFRCITEDDDASTSYTSDSTASLLHS